MTDRGPLFDSEPVSPITGLLALTEPDPDDRVRAIIDIPLIGPRSAGKSQLAAAILRTLKARAPELPPAEAESNRAAMRAVMGGELQSGREGNHVPHYTFRVSMAALLDMLPGSARLNLLLGANRLALPIGTTALAIALVAVAGWMLSPPLAALIATGAIALLAALFARQVRVATAHAQRDGDVELVIWDPPGSLYDADRAADLYDFLAHLSRRRTMHRPPWRGYAFLPMLVVNPIDYGSAARRRDLGRLRGLLPMFAALGGERPNAIVAVTRWALVAAACPTGSNKDENITVSVVDRDGEQSRYELPRDTIAAELVETEDGSEAGLELSYLRYDAAPETGTELRNDALEYTAESSGGTLVGQSRRSLVKQIARLALAPSLTARESREPENLYLADDAPARDIYEPDPIEARVTLEAMTHALRTQT